MNANTVLPVPSQATHYVRHLTLAAKRSRRANQIRGLGTAHPGIAYETVVDVDDRDKAGYLSPVR